MSSDISIETGKTKKFSPLDYAIFAAILLISASIGFYHAWKDRKNQNLKDFLMAGRNMHVLPVALSMIASFMSAITLLGVPVEMYAYNSMYFWIGLGYTLVMFGAAYLYVPIFYMLRVTSVYEYLEKRFSKMVRTAASMTFVIQMTMYMAIVLYAPSLALNAVTGFTLWGAVVSVGVVCTIYTAFGGMKAVLWTDCFQTVIMLVGLLAVLIKGSMAVGGFSRAWEKMETSHRVLFDDVSVDPSVRHTVWSLTVGGYFTWVAIYGVNQAQVQRACTCPTLKRGQLALLLNAPGLCCILYLGCLIGVVVYAFYSECDPISAGLINSKDQILPLFVMDVLGDVIGLPGLFVACLFSGALSTISSGLNSIAAAVLEDVVRLYWAKDISDLWATRLTQIIALIFGLLCLALTYVASQLGNVLTAALSLFGMIAGPLLGVFTLGMFCPWANQWGAITGLFTSLVFMFWIGVGAFIEKPPVIPDPAPQSTIGCGNFSIFASFGPSNMTANALSTVTTVLTTATNATTTEAPERSPEYYLYTLSYIWYGMYSVLTVVVVGLIVSFLTGYTKPSSVDPKLICPIFDIIPPFRFLPESVRKPLRFGLVHKGKYDNMPTDEDTLKTLEEMANKSLGDVLDKTIVIDANGTKSKETNGVANPAVSYAPEDEIDEHDGSRKDRNGVSASNHALRPRQGYANAAMEGDEDGDYGRTHAGVHVTRI